MEHRRSVFVSSAVEKLATYRPDIIDACMRSSMFPILYSNLPASSANKTDYWLSQMADAHVYLGIYAHQYGDILPEEGISLLELEYSHAQTNQIPCLMLFIDEQQPVTPDLYDSDTGREKLASLKARIRQQHAPQTFTTPEDLRAQIINALKQYRATAEAGANIHHISGIPQPPEVYVAHPYTLLSATQLVGRQTELNWLTDWVAKPSSELYNARILNVVAIGGMGKSALTWHWFNEIAPQEMKPLAGRMWWSFYESDARWENFIIRALAYVSRRSREDIRKNTKPGEREDMLLQILNREPYLLVLDGLERELLAYARMDAAHLADDDLDQKTANIVAGAIGLPEGAGQSFTGQFQLRKTADPRAGNFLRKLASVQASRILVSTRLYPAALQMITGAPIRGSSAIFLPGLEDHGALELWRSLGVGGSRDELLPIFQRFDNYPLLIRALAGEVARFHGGPGDFSKWLERNSDFTRVLMNLRREDAKSHVLAHALQGLSKSEQQVLHTIAAFRAPADYETLVALMVGEAKPFASEDALRRSVNRTRRSRLTRLG